MKSRIRSLKRSRNRRRVTLALFGVSLAAALALAWLFLNTSLCGVERINMQGVRYGIPEDMLLESGIKAGVNLFSDLSTFEKSLAKHPLVREVRFERRPPRTLFIRVEERVPFVFLNQAEPVPLSEEGVLLPEDRIAGELDLPLLTLDGDEASRARGQSEGLQFLSHLKIESPALFDRLSELVVINGNPAMLFVRMPRARIQLGERFTRISARLLSSALAGLKGDDGYFEIDLRFRDQAIVRYMGNPGAASLHGAI
jgi:hypothetical protein